MRGFDSETYVITGPLRNFSIRVRQRSSIWKKSMCSIGRKRFSVQKKRLFIGTEKIVRLKRNYFTTKK
ncbi:unnamed protein product [Schistosoma rodhaini]|nr:unnamed protein product [Schistosoma rodhaini]